MDLVETEVKGHSPTRVLDFEGGMSTDNGALDVLADLDITASPSPPKAAKNLVGSPGRSVRSASSSVVTDGPSKDYAADDEKSSSKENPAEEKPVNISYQEDPTREEEVDEEAEDAVEDHVDTPEAAQRLSPRNVVEIENLKNRAIKLASRGKEEQAIQSYYRSLRLMRVDLNSITKRLSNDQQKWREEWLVTAASMAEVRTAIAILYERLGAYVKAIAACKEAREIYENSPLIPDEGKEKVPQVETGVRQMDHMMQRLDIAKQSFSERKTLHEEALQILSQIQVARTTKKRDDLYRKTFVILKGVLDMEKESVGETHPQVAETLCSLSKVHKERGEIAEAIKYMNRALSILKLCVGPYHPRSAIAFRELAKLYDARQKNRGDVDMAIGLYSQATASFRECYGNKSPMVGASLNNEAVLHITQSNFDLAVERLSDALVAYESSSMNKDKTINTDSALVWKNLGECYTRREEFESAHFAYNNALEIQKDARMQAEKLGKPVTQGCDDATLADTLLRLGNATKQTHRYENAHGIYKEALLIYRMHYTSAHRASKGRISDALADAQDRLAHTLYCIAEVQEIRGVYDEAEALYSEALQLRLHSDAQREQHRMNMVHCAMALAGIGSCHLKKRQFDDAIAVYKESITYLVKHGVPDNHSLMTKLKTRLEQAEEGVNITFSFSDHDAEGEDSDEERTDPSLQMDAESKRLMEGGQYDKAIEVLSDALSIRRRRLTRRQKDKDAPEFLEEKEDVAMTLVNYATILFEKGEVRQSEMITREAVAMYKSNGYGDDHPTVQALNAELKKLTNLTAL